MHNHHAHDDICIIMIISLLSLIFGRSFTTLNLEVSLHCQVCDLTVPKLNNYTIKNLHFKYMFTSMSRLVISNLNVG